MPWTDKVFLKSPDFVSREIAGESILVPIRGKLGDVQNIYVLNETAAALWSRLDGRRAAKDILEDLAKEFDAALTQLEQDFDSLIKDLLSIQAINEISG